MIRVIPIPLAVRIRPGDDLAALLLGAIADAGEALPDLRQALAEANDEKGRVTTPEQMLVRQALKAA